MKDIEKIIADLQAWVEEDKENRAIALVAVQKTEDKDPENGLHKVLKHAIRSEAMTGLIEFADRLLKKSDKKSENSSEEGKEADHE